MRRNPRRDAPKRVDRGNRQCEDRNDRSSGLESKERVATRDVPDFAKHIDRERRPEPLGDDATDRGRVERPRRKAVCSPCSEHVEQVVRLLSWNA